MKKTIRILAALVCLLMALCVGFAVAETAETPVPADTPRPTPSPTPIPTPSEEDLGELTFVINGPDESMPMTVRYSEFTDGKFSLNNLAPGTYTVTEVDPDLLLSDLEYDYDYENSVQAITIEVKAEETATDTLRNVYERTVEITPTPSPEPSENPDESPQPSETPEPNGDEKIDIPVAKEWDDNNDRDRNRPAWVMVKLLSNGNKAGEAALTAATDWKYTFKDMPKYDAKKQEIVYTVEENEVPMYTATIDGYTITNHYIPETTSVTVSKVWNDNNNSAGMRPLSIYCTLSNGTHVTLNAANNWTATVENLPVTINGQKVTYTWTEQEAVGYTQTDIDINGNTTVFTNSLVERPSTPPEGKNPPPKTRGARYAILEDYGTPLGVDVVINHVGDCFD